MAGQTIPLLEGCLSYKAFFMLPKARWQKCQEAPQWKGKSHQQVQQCIQQLYKKLH